MNFGGASIYAAGYYSNTETKWALNSGRAAAASKQSVAGTTNLFGLIVQGSMYVAPKWEIFGRYQYIDPLTQPTINRCDNSVPKIL